MSFQKSILTSILIAGMSLPAFAGSLIIFNNTDFPSTSKINGFVCSRDVLGPKDGVTPKRTKKTIEEKDLVRACFSRTKECIADVYITDNCTGTPITQVTFTVANGVSKVTPPKMGYTESHSAFYIQVNAPGG